MLLKQHPSSRVNHNSVTSTSVSDTDPDERLHMETLGRSCGRTTMSSAENVPLIPGLAMNYSQWHTSSLTPACWEGKGSSF